MSLTAKPKTPLLAALVAAEHAGVNLDLIWNGKVNDVVCDIDGKTVTGVLNIAKFFTQNISEDGEWVSRSSAIEPRTNFKDLSEIALELEKTLQSQKYLGRDSYSLGDIMVYSGLKTNSVWNNLVKKGGIAKDFPSTFKWFTEFTELSFVSTAIEKCFARPVAAKSNKAEEKKNKNHYAELPNAVVGEVVVRFPPEASGFLHIGHAKAAILNYIYAQQYKGKLIMRFDDTNPDKEDGFFEQIILQDLETLGVKYDHKSHTSDFFDRMLDLASEMINKGLAYVDDSPTDVVRQERFDGIDGKNRELSIEKNLSLWEEMKEGTEKGLTCCLRAKIGMQIPNKCMRDPVIYRCNLTPHVRTGEKYKVYPTYDFACPIVDSLEGITHVLRTNEYRDRKEQFEWFCNALGLRVPIIHDYSRLNMMYTVMSKRKLTWFVEKGYVTGWDDPRFPTVRGVLRRGLTVEGLKSFIMEQGASRSANLMEWDKIWAVNKQVIDPIAPRYMALDSEKAVTMTISNVNDSTKTIDLHPKNPSVGKKEIAFTKTVFIEGDDAQTIKSGEKVTLQNWGNFVITSLDLDNQKVTADYLPDDSDFKETKKLNWVSTQDVRIATGVELDHLITKKKITDEKLEDILTPQSWFETKLICEAATSKLVVGDIIQFVRRGYFRVDSVDNGLVLINIPDGRQSHVSSLTTKATSANRKDDAPASTKSRKQLKKEAEAAKKAAAASAPASSGPMAELSAEGKVIDEKITEQGKLIRTLKGNGAPATDVTDAVKTLLSLKEEFKKATGSDWVPAGGAPQGRTKKANKPATASSSSGKQKPKQQPKQQKKQNEGKKEQPGITVKKDDDFSEWYLEVIKKAELVAPYPVTGCFVLRPNAYSIWEFIQGFLDKSFKSTGVENCYFPMFVKADALQKEVDNFDDFQPEVAWVTRCGDNEFTDPLALRPTSEAVMYPSVSDWIRSHRDLPLKLNQWCNIVRWEFKDAVPFLRTREFLWQEGHSAFASQEEAAKEVMDILEFYRSCYEDLLAVAVVPGKKSEKEKFAGGLYTTTVEAYIEGSGRAIQGATSHCLGQHFSKLFDVGYLDQNGDRQHAIQNSWGYTTRSIGVMIMTHSDDKGLVLPPKVAKRQIVIVPCGLQAKTPEEEKKKLESKILDLEHTLKDAGLRAISDLRENMTAGRKFNHWEIQGIPIRIEVGPRDLEKGSVMCCTRHDGKKISMPMDGLAEEIKRTLDDVHNSLLENSRQVLERNIKQITKFEDFVPALDNKHLCLIPWCESVDCEEDIKANSKRQTPHPTLPIMGAKSLCIPFKQPSLPSNAICVKCGTKAKSWTLFGRSY